MFKELFSREEKIIYSDDIINILRLIRSENVGPRTFFHLIKLFGTASIALDNIEAFSIRGGRSKAIKVFSRSDAEREIELLTKHNAQIITYKSPLYSSLLLEIYDPPPLLSYKGNINLLNHPRPIAIVGARNASINGRFFATKISKELIEQEYIVVSGLARGIDAAAHEASIPNTIAVIAGGIDHIYPPENAKLYANIANNGLIIAELAIGSEPIGQHFPQRNRLISGLSIGTIVIEAGLKSGSLITARNTLEQNRELFVVPGFPLDPRSLGGNKLLKNGAHLVESIEDIISNLSNYSSNQSKTSLNDAINNDNNFKQLDIKYLDQVTDEMRKQILLLLSAVPVHFSQLEIATNLPIQIIYAILLEFELAGKITRDIGNHISLIYLI
jgi:DNA processing protein